MHTNARIGSSIVRFSRTARTHDPEGIPMLKAYSRTIARINSLRTEEDGATATEYALIIGVASIAIVAALALIAPAITNFVNTDIIPKL